MRDTCWNIAQMSLRRMSAFFNTYLQQQVNYELLGKLCCIASQKKKNEKR